jgi:hypothetical protein
MFKKPDNIFITYTHPNDQKRKANRHTVSSFVSKSYRPTSRKIVFERSHYRPFTHAEAECKTVPESSTDRSVPQSSVADRSNTSTPETSLARESTETKRDAPDASVCRRPARRVTNEPALTTEDSWLVDSLMRRFSSALNTDRSRYESFLLFASRNAECYHALLAQAYYHIDAGGFGNPPWLALYHRGEAMKLLREKMEAQEVESANDCYAIFTAAMLLSVEYAHTDRSAWLLHKRALESMVADKGGKDKLCYRLRDEMLRNEFFLQVLVNGKVDVCEWAGGVKLRLQDCYPMEDAMLMGLPLVFQSLAHQMTLNAAAARFMLRFLMYLYDVGRYRRPTSQYSTYAMLDFDVDTLELERILELVDTRKSEYVEHQACLALLVFVFNLHNQEEAPDEYLTILDDAAVEMTTIKNAGPLSARKCLCWSVASVGAAAATESPWRLDIPFMSHVIRMMARGEENTSQLRKMLHSYYLYGAAPQRS